MEFVNHNPILLFGIISVVTIYWQQSNNKLSGEKSVVNKSAYEQLIGKTQMIRLNYLSAVTKKNIYLKMESLNPGGTGKDRAVQNMLDAAEASGELKAGMNVVEGTSGSTGISLAYQCRTRGYHLHIVMPDDQAEEKRILLEKLGANVLVVPSSSIANKNHYVNRAREYAKEVNGVFINQFENASNCLVHYRETGPEIWKQTNGEIKGFVMSSGTGGTIAGVSMYLKEKNQQIKVILADPNGSSLFNKVKYNVCYAKQQSEKTIRKHRYDSIVEGVGLDRITQNFNQAIIDDAYQIPDQDLLIIAHWMLKHEGLMIGSSTALNLAVVLRSLNQFQDGDAIVTIACDNGNRHLSRFWNPIYVEKYQLRWPEDDQVDGEFEKLLHTYRPHRNRNS